MHRPVERKDTHPLPQAVPTSCHHDEGSSNLLHEFDPHENQVKEENSVSPSAIDTTGSAGRANERNSSMCGSERKTLTTAGSNSIAARSMICWRASASL